MLQGQIAKAHREERGHYGQKQGSSHVPEKGQEGLRREEEQGQEEPLRRTKPHELQLHVIRPGLL